MSASNTEPIVVHDKRIRHDELAVSERPAGPIPPTTMALLQTAVAAGNIDMIERLVALHERTQAREAEVEYNNAMSSAQEEMRSVAVDLDNSQTKSKYASYAAIDKAIRPIYTRHGFGVSFDTADSAKPEHIKIICKVSHRGGHSETKQVDMPCDGKGAKGGDVMTKTHATGAAMAYGQRYLVKLAFNIATGEADLDGNSITNGEVAEQCEWIANARNMEELKSLYQQAYKKAEAAKDKNAMAVIIDAKDKRKAKLEGAE